MSRSVEQLVRDILTQAVEDGLVQPRFGRPGGSRVGIGGAPPVPNNDPQRFSAGDLMRCGNTVTTFLQETIRRALGEVVA